ncbi:disintegrin and metalloproteinase domain-containing protein 15 isoform X2 [Scleropages formosus]|uniref:disintegrin and metalloproteinase domain-containing protein 15 isoform X2 n=1 Tax=Scleropages formosus TaxID=113540 RepID=UPI0010FA6C46|nr:disintegrin and metalloproteinase domain-containing protein 15 isoform X2 [Scleropages formosus]
MRTSCSALVRLTSRARRLSMILLLEMSALIRGVMICDAATLPANGAFGAPHEQHAGAREPGDAVLPEVGGHGAVGRDESRPRSSAAESPRLSYTDRRWGRREEPLETIRSFIVVDGRRRSPRQALQNGHPDKLHCELHIRGHTYLLDLEKNRDLLPKSPSVFYYLPNGVRVSADDNSVVHCYYQGFVRGFPDSRVALSTCTGLRGVIVFNSTWSFELQPKEDKQEKEENTVKEEDDVHLLYPTYQLDTQAGDCGVSSEVVPPLYSPTSMHRSKRDILLETKYIELVLVVDHKEYLTYQNNRTVIYRMMDVANQVDWFYRPLNVRVALVGLEIWNDKDKIQVDKNPTDTLNRFLEWRTRELLPRLRHDNAQLIMGGSFDGTTVGMASQSSMCSKDRSGGVNVDHLVSVLGVASTVAHELGHNLGMNHDTEERNCQCQNEPRLGGCIMKPSTGFMPGQLFSSCSAQDLSVSLLHGAGMCLFNVPQPEKLLGGPRCGNLYVEKGEECDCGLADECNDPCCNYSTCKLVPGAQCSSDGICCENCKLRGAGWMCREALGECDLPEYCTGTSPYCPPNVFLQSGEPCKDGTSYCFGGICASLDSQCQTLWGSNSTQAPEVCFSSVNKQGNKFGNCGQLPNGTFIPCPASDVYCGKIQCLGGNSRPLLGSNAEILTTTVRLSQTATVCHGTSFNLSDDVSDPAMVAEGTPCGPGKVCMAQRCRDVSVLGVEDCNRKCSSHGVCNSNKNCHCEVGWAPPECKYAGHGGSVDSGPAQEPRVSDPTRVALLVIFLFVLPVMLLFMALRLQYCRRWLLCLGSSSFFKSPGRQQSRTPATDRTDTRNGEQVQPLRYHWPKQVDIPLTPASNKVHDKPPPPNKPLPPDPVIKHTQSAGERPPPPNKPLPPDPIPKVSKLAVDRPAPPNKPLPPDPVLTDSQTHGPTKPLPPKKPLIPEAQMRPACGVTSARPTSTAPLHHPATSSSVSGYGPHVAVIPARRAPLPPTRTSQPGRSHSPPPV